MGLRWGLFGGLASFDYATNVLVSKFWLRLWIKLVSLSQRLSVLIAKVKSPLPATHSFFFKRVDQKGEKSQLEESQMRGWAGRIVLLFSATGLKFPKWAKFVSLTMREHSSHTPAHERTL